MSETADAIISPVKIAKEFSVETAAKWVTLAGGLTYAVGFLVNSLYTGKYGVAEFSFLKAKGLVAGLEPVS